MNKAESVKEFVERVDQAKKKNPKDLSSDQDLTIAIMNLISIEEHLIFSGAKTGKTSFYDMVQDVRELRKNLMQKIIPAYEGEVWCISKHLLGSAYRLMEVGTKQQSMGNTEEAYDLFDKAYELYCLFWGLNMNAINLKDVEWVKDAGVDVKEIQSHLDNLKIANQDVKVSKSVVKAEKKSSKISKLKDAVKKAVNCCIE